MAPVYALTRAAYSQIVAQAKAGFPFEICGFLGGPGEGSGSLVRPATNISSHPQAAYDIAPEEILASLVGFESQGQKITAIYHSHPNYPARPSNIDLKLADMPNVAYLIVGVQQRGLEFETEVRAFHIQDRKPYEIQLEVVD